MIKLVVLDIDGVLSEGKSSWFSSEIISVLSSMNHCSQEDPSAPPATVITGRPGPYIEAFIQVIHGTAPAVFEQGTGLYNPVSYQFSRHPEMGDLGEFYLLKQVIIEKIVGPGYAVMQIGKEYTISIFNSDKEINRKLKRMIIDEAGEELCSKFDIIYSSDSLNIMPKGFHKGKGIQLLSSATNIGLDEMLGIGDSAVDIPFLEKVGFHACPINSSDEVKQLCSYCSPEPYGAGVIDILRHFCCIP